MGLARRQGNRRASSATYARERAAPKTLLVRPTHSKTSTTFAGSTTSAGSHIEPHVSNRFSSPQCFVTLHGEGRSFPKGYHAGTPVKRENSRCEQHASASGFSASQRTCVCSVQARARAQAKRPPALEASSQACAAARGQRCTNLGLGSVIGRELHGGRRWPVLLHCRGDVAGEGLNEQGKHAAKPHSAAQDHLSVAVTPYYTIFHRHSSASQPHALRPLHHRQFRPIT